MQLITREVYAKKEEEAMKVLKLEKELMQMLHQTKSKLRCRERLPVLHQDKIWLVGHRRPAWQKS